MWITSQEDSYEIITLNEETKMRNGMLMRIEVMAQGKSGQKANTSVSNPSTHYLT